MTKYLLLLIYCISQPVVAINQPVTVLDTVESSVRKKVETDLATERWLNEYDRPEQEYTQETQPPPSPPCPDDDDCG